MLVAALGCSSAEGVGSPPARAASSSGESDAASTIEIFTWFAQPGEQGALASLGRLHAQRWPQDVLLQANAELSGTARSTVERRLERGEPPETFQANIGTDLMRWVVRNGTDARESRLQPLDDLMPDAVQEWRNVLPPVLVRDLSFDGKMYAVPVHVHRINSLFYHVGIFEKYGLPIPKTLADVDLIARTLEGTGIHPIAFGSREPWTLVLLAFECVFVAEHGAAVYDQYFHGGLKSDDPRVLQSLETTLRLLEYVNPSHPRLSWRQALDLLIRGDAAMFVMGDWARGTMQSRGVVMGEQIQEIPFPGSDETFVYTADTFPIPKGVRNQAGAIRLMITLGSTEGQRILNAAKGALAPRIDAEPPSVPEMRAKYELFWRGPLVLAMSGVAPSRFTDDLGEALAEMAASRDVEPVVFTLRSRYLLLR